MAISLSAFRTYLRGSLQAPIGDFLGALYLPGTGLGGGQVGCPEAACDRSFLIHHQLNVTCPSNGTMILITFPELRAESSDRLATSC